MSGRGQAPTEAEVGRQRTHGFGAGTTIKRIVWPVDERYGIDAAPIVPTVRWNDSIPPLYRRMPWAFDYDKRLAPARPHKLLLRK